MHDSKIPFMFLFLECVSLVILTCNPNTCDLEEMPPPQKKGIKWSSSQVQQQLQCIFDLT